MMQAPRPMFVTPASRRSDATATLAVLKKDPAFQKRFREENEALPLEDPADDDTNMMSPSKRLQPRNLDFARVASSDDLFGVRTTAGIDALAEIAALKDDDQEETLMTQDDSAPPPAPSSSQELEEGELFPSPQSPGFARCMSEALWP